MLSALPDHPPMPLCSSLGPPGQAESCRPRASRPTRAAGTRWRHTRAPGTTCWARAGCGCAAWSSSGASISPLGPPGPAESGPPRGARSARAPGTRRTRGRRTGAGLDMRVLAIALATRSQSAYGVLDGALAQRQRAMIAMGNQWAAPDTPAFVSCAYRVVLERTTGPQPFRLVKISPP